VTGDQALALDEALETAATGDLWLFRGRSLADRAIQTVTNSPVNHVGMVVALDDLPPLLWHAELGKSLPDVWTGDRQRGVQLHKLADAVATWRDRYGQRAWTRQLEGAVERDHEDRLMEMIERRPRVPDDPPPRPPVADRAGSPTVVLFGDALLRGAGGHHLPAHGNPPEQAARQLV